MKCRCDSVQDASWAITFNIFTKEFLRRVEELLKNGETVQKKKKLYRRHFFNIKCYFFIFKLFLKLNTIERKKGASDLQKVHQHQWHY